MAGTLTVTESNHFPLAGVYVPLAEKVLLVSVGTAATVIVPVVHLYEATAVCEVAFGVIVVPAWVVSCVIPVLVPALT